MPGSRYGVRTRKRESEVLTAMRQKHECPKCGKPKVKRRGTSRWACSSCGAEFAGGAYMPQTDIGTAAKKAIDSLAG